MMILCVNKLTNKNFKVLYVFLWSTWLNRNQKVHGNWCDASEGVIRWSVCFLNELQDANQVDKARQNVVQTTNKKWVNPVIGMYKANTASISNGNHCKIGIGMILRDHKGLVMGATTQPIFSPYSPHVAKAIAVL
ncbi:hypothetical protein Ddye_016230 [Dipteronia dyeriana]|uniref:RNase H type-1 domain-containing protein n=1 Tax=Dipteronia dyeriana TaxID=168575 RepID=A0AAD9U714_9ROSI|nr:hypothetical protein Ddye_016230 [Dipteronia dyeriana]